MTPLDAMPINHDDALQLALIKQDESNLARCYLELRMQMERDAAMQSLTDVQQEMEKQEPAAYIIHDRVAEDRLSFVKVKESLQTEVTPLFTHPTTERRVIPEDVRKVMEMALSELEADGVYGLDHVAIALRNVLNTAPAPTKEE